METVRSESAASGYAMGSEMYSASGGMITSGHPLKSNAWSEAGSIALEPDAVGRAMWTEVRWSAWVPNAFDRCTRIIEPPRDTCTVSRRVASVRSADGNAFRGSGICCDAAQVPTHICGVVVSIFAGSARATHKSKYFRVCISHPYCGGGVWPMNLSAQAIKYFTFGASVWPPSCCRHAS